MAVGKHVHGNYVTYKRHFPSICIRDIVLTVLAVGTIVFSWTHTRVLGCLVLTHSPVLAGLAVTLIHICTGES